MSVVCNVENCGETAVLKRPKTGDPLCKKCFYFIFETEIHVTIMKGELFKRGDKVAIGASGGKDSTVLAYILKLLNDRYDYGLDLFLLSIDEGITGYRDDSLETVKKNRDDYKLPLKILSYKDLYGWTMDEIVEKIGKKNNCTFCGVFRRQALDRGAALIGADVIVTGHNADDMAETIIMNILRGDLARLLRCTSIITEGEGTIPRCKPLKYAYEKEIVMYAHYKELVYFSTECMYAPNAFRGHTREYIKDLERVRPSCILDIIHSGEIAQANKSVVFPKRRTCVRCRFVASQEICKACVLLVGLNIGQPKLGIGKSNKAKKTLGITVSDGSENKSKKKLNNPQNLKETKRKIKQKNKKQFTCKENCKSSCNSKNSEKSIADVNISDSFLLIQDDTNCNNEEETFCYSAIEQFKSSISEHFEQSSDYCKCMSCSKLSEINLKEDPINDPQKQKELVDCKNFPKFQLYGDDKFDELNPDSNCDYNVNEFEPSILNKCFQKSTACSKSTDCFTSLNSQINLNNHLTNTFQEKEEFIECKCPLSFQINTDHKLDQSNSNLNNDNTEYEGPINLNILAKFFLSDKRSDLFSLLTMYENSKNEQASSSIGNESELLDSISIEDFFYIYELVPFPLTEEELKKSSVSFDLDFDEKFDNLELDLLDFDDKLSSLIIDESKSSEGKLLYKSANKNTVHTSFVQTKQNEVVTRSLNVQMPKDTESPLTKSSNILSKSLDEQPNIVKATPTRVKPSLILPEMMYKTKNNLEF